MNGADLRGSLIATLRYLLDYKDNIELQLAEAKSIIMLSVEQGERDKLSPISIDNDAVWFNYLVESRRQVENDIALAENALSQLGVSVPTLMGSTAGFTMETTQNQGDYALDFSVSREK